MIVFGGNNHVYGLLNPSSVAYFGYETSHDLTTTSDGHGSLVASVYTGNVGDTSTLTYTPNTYYGFSGYTLEGGGSIAGNTYTFGSENATAKAWFSANNYTITTANDGHGTCTCNRNSVTGGSTATLSNTPATYYAFNSYQVTGGSVNGSTLTVTSDCTAKATFTVTGAKLSAYGDSNSITYITATYNGATTSWNSRSDGSQTASRVIPYNSNISVQFSAGPYYRSNTRSTSNVSNFTTAFNTSNTHLVTGTCKMSNTAGYVGGNAAQYKITATCTMDSKFTAYSVLTAAMKNNGGIYYTDLKPTAVSISQSVAGVPTAGLIKTETTPWIEYCSARNTTKITATNTGVNYPCPYFEKYNASSIRVTGTVNVTARSQHVSNVWSGNGASGSQRALNMRALNSNTAGTTSWNTVAWNGNFFTGGGTASMKTQTTAFNVNYTIPFLNSNRTWKANVTCPLAVPTSNTGTANTKIMPPNQITSAKGTLTLTALIK